MIAIRKFLLPVLTITTLISLATVAGHADEQPHFKYSQQANKGGASAAVTNETWFQTMTATGLISLVPFVILFVIPVDNSPKKRAFLHILLAFASGGLLGDAFLHLIPHANIHAANHEEHHEHDVHEHEHDAHGHHHHEHGNLNIGLGVLAGIIVFLAVEKFIRLIKSKSLSSSTSTRPPSKNANTKKSQTTASASTIKISGCLNLVADFIHNFTDGLAIAASFLAANRTGIVTSLTILLHEVPHEIGDYAILIQSGFSKRKAILLQLVTAVGAFSGAATCLLLGSDLSGTTAVWMISFTAGGFIYIALVSVIPELLSEHSASLKQSVYQVLAILTGVAMMWIIAQYE